MCGTECVYVNVWVNMCVCVQICEPAHLGGCTMCESTGMIMQERALPACIEACVSLHRHVSECVCVFMNAGRYTHICESIHL